MNKFKLLPLCRSVDGVMLDIVDSHHQAPSTNGLKAYHHQQLHNGINATAGDGFVFNDVKKDRRKRLKGFGHVDSQQLYREK